MKFISELCGLEGKKIILASQSPRRIEMLHSVGLEFEIHPAHIDENPDSYRDAVDYVRENARGKAEKVLSQHPGADLVIAADTIVVKDGRIYEKPAEEDQARSMLQDLSGSAHQVITGFCLLTPTGQVIDHETTDVTFYPLSEAEIETYIASGEPFDKAGAYGIQGLASVLIKSVEGCYFNVVGFPLGKFYQRLKELTIWVHRE